VESRCVTGSFYGGLLINLVNRLLTHVGNRYAVILCFYVESLRRSGRDTQLTAQFLQSLFK
jgi:hypothetical protein